MLTLAANHLITTFQAIVLGILQGATELFPVSSLGHTVIFPNLFGWHNIVHWQSQAESPWLAFVVMLHVGSAIGLLIYFWRDWIDLIRAFFVSVGRMLRLRRWSVETSKERLVWLIIFASIPTGILGLILEHPIRDATAKPLIASIFLIVNGFILLGAERLRRQANTRAGHGAAEPATAGERAALRQARRSGAAVATATADGGAVEPGRRLDTLEYREGVLIGVAQSGALIAGISRDGIVMAAGLLRGLDNYDAGRFGFLLATPIILAAGIFKLSDLTGAHGAGIRGAAVVAALFAAITAIITVHFLTRYFKRGNLNPFGIYCLLFGAAMVIYNA